MSKYQEALDVINQSDDEKFIKDCRAYFEKYKINPVAVIQKLVDKEKGKKPIYKDDGYGMRYYFCRSCNERVPVLANCIDQYKYLYCPYCGQKLDWSDSE